MAYLKFSENLFLGKQELQHFKEFLDNSGFRKFFEISIANYGVVQNAIGSFTHFQTQIGTNTNSIKVLAGLAIDSNVQMITLPTIDNIALPANSNWYWVKISYAASSLESGVFSVDSAGNLTGVGSSLLSILRGMPNIPSRIKFPNATLNTGEYDVNTVTNNSSATLSGSFVNESNLTLSVIGSFAADAVPLSGDKNIFQYDSCSMTLVLETVLNTPPTLISGLEFVIARVQNTGSGYNIQDKRALNLFNGTGGSGLYLPLSGGTLSGALSMNNNNITNLAAAAATGQAVRYEQLIGQYLLLSGGIMSGILNMNSHIISNLTPGSVAGQAVNYEQIGGLWTVSIDIGDWNMDTTSSISISIPGGVTYDQIRSVKVSIKSDLIAGNYQLDDLIASNAGSWQVDVVGLDTTHIQLARVGGGIFDNSTYDSTSYNRGWLIIQYQL